MIKIERTQRWIFFGLLLIVVPASLLAYMSWRFLSQIEADLVNDRQKEIVFRANQLQDYELGLLQQCERYLSHLSQEKTESLALGDDIQDLFVDHVLCDRFLRPLNVHQELEWDRNPGAKLDQLIPLDPQSRHLETEIRQVGFLSDEDQEITKRLLLARSLKARGLLKQSIEEFLNLSVRFPHRQEALFAVLACIELSASAAMPEDVLEACLTQASLLVAQYKRSRGMYRFLSRHLKEIYFSNEALNDKSQKLIQKINQLAGLSFKSRSLLMDELERDREILLTHRNKGFSFVKGSQFIWCKMDDEQHDHIALVLVDVKKWFEKLNEFWNEHPGSFSLDIEFVTSEEQYQINDQTHQVHLLFPQAGAQITLSESDRLTKLFYKQAQLGTWGTIFLVFILIFGTVMAVAAVVQAQKISRLKSEFVSTVSHELRTPLTSIQMFIESLKEERIQSESGRKESYAIIEKETKRLKNLIDRLLAFSALERGGVNSKKVPVALDRVCRHCVDLVTPQFQKESMRLEANIPEKEVEILGDANILVEIVVNLLSNALKYAKEGQIVELSLHDDDKNCLILVQDRGPGIQMGHKEKLFGAFVQGSYDNPLYTKGAGLGLSLVKGWVKWHGGTIDVYNRDGGGATFEVSLPKINPREHNNNVEGER